MNKLTVYVDGEKLEGRHITIALTNDEEETRLIEIDEGSSRGELGVRIKTQDLCLDELRTDEHYAIKAKLSGKLKD